MESITMPEAPSGFDTVESVETPMPSTHSFEDGGEISGQNLELVYYLTFALLISASVYSIYYHRQAMNRLSDTSNGKLAKDIQELKTNLKNLMGDKYESNN
jgi:hypothetical protein